MKRDTFALTLSHTTGYANSFVLVLLSRSDWCDVRLNPLPELQPLASSTLKRFRPKVARRKSSRDRLSVASSSLSSTSLASSLQRRLPLRCGGTSCEATLCMCELYAHTLSFMLCVVSIVCRGRHCNYFVCVCLSLCHYTKRGA